MPAGLKVPHELTRVGEGQLLPRPKPPGFLERPSQLGTAIWGGVWGWFFSAPVVYEGQLAAGTPRSAGPRASVLLR